MNSARYNVRYWSEVDTDGDYPRVRHLGWWVYDWDKYKTVRTFPVSEQEQADGLCKLLNSIEEEEDGLSK